VQVGVVQPHELPQKGFRAWLHDDPPPPAPPFVFSEQPQEDSELSCKLWCCSGSFGSRPDITQVCRCTCSWRLNFLCACYAERECQANPRHIDYLQETIAKGMKLYPTKTLDDLVDEIRHGDINFDTFFETLRCVEHNGRLVALDNRRLYIAKVLYTFKHLQTIHVHIMRKTKPVMSEFGVKHERNEKRDGRRVTANGKGRLRYYAYQTANPWYDGEEVILKMKAAAGVPHTPCSSEASTRPSFAARGDGSASASRTSSADPLRSAAASNNWSSSKRGWRYPAQ